MLVVTGEARPERASAATCSHSRRHGLADLQQPGAGHPPRLADRGLAARHPDRPQVADPLEADEVAAQQLAAPDGAVGAVAGAVVDRARRPLHAVLGQRRREVRVVVLDADRLQPEVERVLGREVLRVQVVRDQLGLHREQPLEVLDPVAEGAQGLVVAQVADVVRDPRAAVAGERERVLELGADREQRRRARDRERRRDEAARAPHDPPAAHDGVVDPRVDRAVVQEEQVRDAVQPLQRVSSERDRLVGHVAARHHQRHARRPPAAGGAAACRGASRRGRSSAARRDGGDVARRAGAARSRSARGGWPGFGRPRTHLLATPSRRASPRRPRRGP